MNNSINYYQQNANRFFEKTLNVDMSSIYDRFLSLMPQNGKILDAGCGSGRDTKVFLDRGFQVHAFDAAPILARLASEYLNHKVEVLRFQELSFNKEFDGIWACASLLHVPNTELPDVLQQMFRALKLGGILYASFKYGTRETEINGRHFTDMDKAGLTLLVGKVKGFSIIETWVSEDLRPDRKNEYWLNTLLKSEADAWPNT